MKRLLVLLITSLATVTLFAQTKPTAFKKFYMDFGTGPASHNGSLVSIGARGVLKNNWTASLSFYSLNMDPKNLPSNYKQGYTLLLIFPVMDPMPSVKMNVFNFTGGRFFQLGRKTWITTEAGLSIGTGETMNFTSQPIEDDFFYVSSNYSTQKKSQTTIGGMLRTDFNWAFTPYAGLSVGAFGNLNSIQSPVGMEIKLIAGWLNTKKRNKSTF
jgi:hypothetical protein